MNPKKRWSPWIEQSVQRDWAVVRRRISAHGKVSLYGTKWLMHLPLHRGILPSMTTKQQICAAEREDGAATTSYRRLKKNLFWFQLQPSVKRGVNLQTCTANWESGDEKSWIRKGLNQFWYPACRFRFWVADMTILHLRALQRGTAWFVV